MKQITMSATKAKNGFSTLLGRAAYGKEHIVVEKKGKPLAVVISFEEYRNLTTPSLSVDPLAEFAAKSEQLSKQFPRKKAEKSGVYHLKKIRLGK